MKLFFVFTLIIIAGCSGSSDGLDDFAPIDASVEVTHDAKTGVTKDSGCDPMKCAAPPNGLLVCCTTDDVCGFKAGAVGICYANNNSDGGGGSGGAIP